MRFEPRVIPGDEPPTDEAGELLLPDDLQALADQLFDDASHLAARYPAESPDKWLAASAPVAAEARVEKRRRGGQWRRVTIAGASLLSLSLLASVALVYWNGIAPSPVETVRSSASHVAERNETDSAPAALSQDVKRSESREAGHETAQFTAHESEVSPVLFLENVSAPQLEGLYDLMEQSGEDAADVSI